LIGERGAGGPVRIEAGPQLELPQRSVGVRPEDTVERGRREAVPGEGELERRDVPPAHADRKIPPSEGPAAPVATERLAGPRPEDAVRGEARTALEPHDRPLGARAENAVDRPRVQTGGPETDLKRGDVRIPCTGRASREGGREEPEHCESRR
jgi:hypothetical protein